MRVIPRSSIVLTLPLLALAVAATWDGDVRERVGPPGATSGMTYVVPLFVTDKVEPQLAEKAGAEFRDSLRQWLDDSTLRIEFKPKQAFHIEECQQQRYCEVIWLEETFDRPNLQTVSLAFRSPDSTFSPPIHPTFKRAYNYSAAWAPELWDNRRAAFHAFAGCMKKHHQHVHVRAGKNPSAC